MNQLVALAVVGGTVGSAHAQPGTPAPNQPQDPYPTTAPAPVPPPAPYPDPYPPYGYQAPVVIAPGPPPGRTGHLELVADFATVGILGTVAAIDARDYDDKNTGTLLVMGGALGGGIALTGDFEPDSGNSPPSGPRTSLMPMLGTGHEVGVAVGGGF